MAHSSCGWVAYAHLPCWVRLPLGREEKKADQPLRMSPILRGRRRVLNRYWDVVQRHKVTQFYTAPTAIRALMSFGPDIISKYDLSSLRVLGSVGEPINPEAWRWYNEHVSLRLRLKRVSL